MEFEVDVAGLGWPFPYWLVVNGRLMTKQQASRFLALIGDQLSAMRAIVRGEIARRGWPDGGGYSAEDSAAVGSFYAVFKDGVRLTASDVVAALDELDQYRQVVREWAEADIDHAD